MNAHEIISIAAIFLGPFGAVLATEWIRRSYEARQRRIQVFRTLMSTRASRLSPTHVEALNLIDIEFDSQKGADKAVVEAWKLYHSHLNDQSYTDAEAWSKRTEQLLVDLLHAMSRRLNYPFDKAHIQNSSYYPKGYGEIELDQHLTRKALIEVLEGRAPLNVISHMNTDQFRGLLAINHARSEQVGGGQLAARPVSNVAHDSLPPS